MDPERFPLPEDIVARLAAPPGRLARPEGRVLAYRSFGDPTGVPVLHCHGAPSASSEAVLYDVVARRRGLRMVSVDRPGVGASTPQPQRTILDFAAEAEALADHLGWERFGVLGGSGGGPYVLALARALPERLRFAWVLAGAGAFEDPALRRHIGVVDRVSAIASRHAPWLLTTAFAVMRRLAVLPPVLLRPLALGARRGDRAVFGDPRFAPLIRATGRSAFAQGAAAVAWDTRILHLPWGFALSEIPAPVDFFQGRRDPFIPFRYAELMAERVPRSTLTAFDDDGHFETIFDLERVIAEAGLGAA